MPPDLTATKLKFSKKSHFGPDLHKRPKYSNEKFTKKWPDSETGSP